MPSFRVKPVDTTGVGDVYNGVLAVALGEGMPLLDAARFANAAGAIPFRVWARSLRPEP